MPWGEPDRPQALNRMLIRLPGCFDVREQGGNLSLFPKRFVRDPVFGHCSTRRNAATFHRAASTG